MPDPEIMTIQALSQVLHNEVYAGPRGAAHFMHRRNAEKPHQH
jgi:hypothetical protein